MLSSIFFPSGIELYELYEIVVKLTTLMTHYFFYCFIGTTVLGFLFCVITLKNLEALLQFCSHVKLFSYQQRDESVKSQTEYSFLNISCKSEYVIPLTI